MPNILLTRIDNRLIHGQVGMTWVNWLGANLVLVADDELATDEVQKKPDGYGFAQWCGVALLYAAKDH